jgi:hypothetical protein
MPPPATYIERHARLCLWRQFSPYTHLSQQSSSSSQQLTTTTTSIDFDISICHPRHCRLYQSSSLSTIQPNLQQPTNQHDTYIMSSCQQPLVRPQPQPQQNRMDHNSDGCVSSTPASTSGRGSMHNIFSSPEIARCSRCHRTPSIDITTGKSNMVQYGLNQYYCSRCAGMVGYYSR